MKHNRRASLYGQVETCSYVLLNVVMDSILPECEKGTHAGEMLSTYPYVSTLKLLKEYQ
jgi:hypothetical protein